MLFNNSVVFKNILLKSIHLYDRYLLICRTTVNKIGIVSLDVEISGKPDVLEDSFVAIYGDISVDNTPSVSG